MIMECAVALLGLFLLYLISKDKLETQVEKRDKEIIGKVKDFSKDGRHANKPYGTARALAFDPLEVRRPVLIPSEKEIEVIVAVGRMIYSYIACNDDASDTIIPGFQLQSGTCNDNVSGALERRKEIVDCITEALGDPNTRIIGVYGSSDARKATLLERVSRRVKRDNLFDVVLMATVTKKSDIKRIQEEIADGLGLKLEKNSMAKRARSLCDRIKNEGKVLVILRDLFKGLDLGKVGIPFGTDHTGCKILLTSNSEEVLSNHMHTQKNVLV